jgi:hypothetical protein
VGDELDHRTNKGNTVAIDRTAFRTSVCVRIDIQAGVPLRLGTTRSNALIITRTRTLTGIAGTAHIPSPRPFHGRLLSALKRSLDACPDSRFGARGDRHRRTKLKWFSTLTPPHIAPTTALLVAEQHLSPPATTMRPTLPSWPARWTSSPRTAGRPTPE